MKAANLFGRFFTPPGGLDKSFVKGSIGAETEEEFRTGDAESAVFQKAIFSPIQESRFAFRIFFFEGFEPAQIRRMNPFGILDFQPPQPIRAINDEIHFHPGTSSPIEHFPFDPGVRNPSAQMLAAGLPTLRGLALRSLQGDRAALWP